MYLAACLLTGQQEYIKIEESSEYINRTFMMKGMKKIN